MVSNRPTTNHVYWSHDMDAK